MAEAGPAETWIDDEEEDPVDGLLLGGSGENEALDKEVRAPSYVAFIATVPTSQPLQGIQVCALRLSALVL